MSPTARTAFENVIGPVQDALSALPKHDADIFTLRLGRYWQDLLDGLTPPYAARPDFEKFVKELVLSLAASYAARPEELKLLDLERGLDPGWFQSEWRVGYVFYVDRFAGTLGGVRERMDYLRELGVGYIHLMPLLKPRPGPNDGGYAVMDYRRVNPALGTMDDLEELCAAFREEGVSVCLDLVLNHCAREHEWAKKPAPETQNTSKCSTLSPTASPPTSTEKRCPKSCRRPPPATSPSMRN